MIITRSIYWAIAVLIGLLALLSLVSPAPADYVYRPVARACDLFGCRLVYRWVPQTYGYRQGDEHEHCSHTTTHQIGILHNTEQGALESAKLLWGAQVRAEMGEQYMDVEAAADVRSRCYRASTNETALGKAAEQVLGAFQWRCELRARACRPGFTYEGKRRR